MAGATTWQSFTITPVTVPAEPGRVRVPSGPQKGSEKSEPFAFVTHKKRRTRCRTMFILSKV